MAAGTITTNLVTYNNIDLSNDSPGEKSKMDLSRLKEGVIRAVFLLESVFLPPAASGGCPHSLAHGLVHLKASDGQWSFSHHTAWC